MFIVYISFAILLLFVPKIRVYTNSLNMIVHEFGHILASILTKGKPIAIEINKDGEGSAQTQSDSKFESVLVSLNGYLFSPSLAFFLIVLLDNGYTTLSSWILILIMITSLVWITNSFGRYMALSFSVLIFVSFLLPYEWINYNLLLLCVALILIDSLVSSFAVFVLSIVNPTESGDAFNLKRKTHITEKFWGFIFIAFNLVMVGICFNFLYF